MSLLLILAEGGWFANLIRQLSSSTSPTFQLTVVFGVFFLVVLGVFAWAAFFRQKPRHRSHRRHRHHHREEKPPAPPPQAGPGPAPFARPRRRRRRHRRSEYDSRHNPTLAETGGLPPRRTEEPPPSPPQPQG